MSEVDIEKRVAAVTLTMSRVPLSLYQEFKELADSEFCGDYGMTLKYIWEDRKRLLSFFELMKKKLEKEGEEDAGKV